jgi:hypothetical protein
MIAGGLNLFFSLGTALSLLIMCVGVWWLIPAAAAGFQTYVGYQMYSGQVSPHAKNSTIAGIAAGVLSFNLLCAAASAFAFMQVGDDEVVGWLEQNGVA